ncbi:MAG: type II toxin-antitoxin system HicA family toxin [Candidatus Jacksonbacteria bacterium]
MISQRGSHIKLKRQIGDQERCLTIPNHKVIRKGTLKNILRILDLTNDGLIHLL